MQSDPARAVALYTRCANEGHVEYMNRLAMLLEEGAEGVDADHARAVQLYIAAIAEGGDAEAMRNLACLLDERAKGGDANHVQAVKYYNRIVEDGKVADVFFWLGRMLRKGESVAAHPKAM